MIRTTLEHMNSSLEEQVKERTQQIEQAMQLQTAILQSAGSAIIACDAKGIITLFNPTAEAMLGYRAEEIVGKQTPTIFHDADEIIQRTEELSQELNSAVEPGFKTFTIKSDLGLFNQRAWNYVRKDGTRFRVLLTITALRDTHNNITGYLGIVVDISQEEKDKQELLLLSNQFKTAAEVAELGIWTWNLDTDEIIWDDKMKAMYQAPEHLTESKHYYQVWRRKIHPEDVDEAERQLRAAIKGTEKFDIVFRIVLKNKTIRYIHAVVATVEYDTHQHPLKMIGINRDITEQRLYEESLYHAKRAADAANDAKSNFLANMSHEIRTPMNAVLGMLQLLEQTNLDKRQLDYVNQAETAAKTLLAILNDILDFSKIEAGKLELDIHPMQINKLFRDIGIIFSANVGKKTIEVLFDIDPRIPVVIMADSLRLQQILVNLGGNAIKFTQKGEVIISATLLDNHCIKISVRDTGIGIHQEHQKHIFKGFSQAEASTARRFGGTGLGLAICERLVTLMGGHISVISQLGQGSEFSFVFPFQIAAKQESLEMTKPEMRKLHALLVPFPFSFDRLASHTLCPIFRELIQH